MVISQVRQKVYDLFMDKYREPRADEKLSESRLIDSSHIQSLMDDKLKHLKESNDYWVTGKGYHIDERILLVPPEIAWNKRPEYFVHLDEVKAIPDTCGEIKELSATDSMSMAYVTLKGRAKEHRHLKMEEMYFITFGQGYLTLSGQKYEIEKGDSISIPKNEWHYLESNSGLELLVATSPRFDPQDVILKE